MKKIMFNDKYGLTQAVLDGYKTMTRRAIKFAHYQVGEVVAIAQSYDIVDDILPYRMWSIETYRQIQHTPGWKNKMFVKADLMPHHIRITNVSIQGLCDISDEDCLREGISKVFNGTYGFKVVNGDKKKIMLYDSPREAFAALIDKVSGKGTWNRNPWVFVYEFELID